MNNGVLGGFWGWMTILVVGSVVACGSGSEERAVEDAQKQDVGSACAALASESCAAIETCSPLELSSDYASLKSCVAIETANCKEFYDLRGVYYEPREVEALAAAFQSRSCRENIEAMRIYSKHAGTLEDGAGCFRDQQCASGACIQDSADWNCGRCGTDDPAGEIGQPCQTVGANTWCRSKALTCVTGFDGTSACMSRAREGEACNDTGCEEGLRCVFDQCKKVSYFGEACDPGADSCHDSECSPDTRTCVVGPRDPSPYPALGEACQRDCAGLLAVCDSICKPRPLVQLCDDQSCSVRPPRGDECN